MSNPTVILAEPLNALGGMKKGDPPVETTAGQAVSFRFWPAIFEKTPLAVEESMPAMLRMLARAMGAKPLLAGEAPTWHWGTHGRWWLETEDGPTCRFSPPGQALTSEDHEVPALAVAYQLTRTDALAAVINWKVSQ